MSDIYAREPWECHESDCEVQWHQRIYWAYTDNTFSVDGFGDGDHEPCEFSEIPKYRELRKAWNGYAEYCAKTGGDPLNQFFVQYTYRTTEKWDVVFVKSIAGIVVQKIRRVGKLYRPHELPDHVRSFLLMRDNGTSSNTQATIKDLETEGLRLNVWQSVYIARDKPRKDSAIERDIKRAARKTCAVFERNYCRKVA